MLTQKNFFCEFKILEKTFETVKIIGESKNILVRSNVEWSFSPPKPGTKNLVKGSANKKSEKQTKDIIKKAKFKIVFAILFALRKSTSISSLKIGIKTMDNVPKISKLKTKSGILKAA